MGSSRIYSAEALRDAKLLVPQSDRPELGDDKYHVLDLLDLKVYNQLTGEAVGVVVNVIPAGNHETGNFSFLYLKIIFH